MTIEHVELNTSDPKAARKFYKGLFGWKYQDMPMPNGVYTMISTKEGKPFGGLQQHPMPGAPSAWLNYVTVKSVQRTVTKAQKTGGTVVVPITTIPGMGSFAVVTDPTGASVGVWQAAPKPKKKAKKKSAKKKSAKKKSAKKKSAKKKSAKKKSAKKKSAKKKSAKKKSAKKRSRKR